MLMLVIHVLLCARWLDAISSIVIPASKKVRFHIGRCLDEIAQKK
uniref:Uncharacterized protein n=1 Tax=Arundo donax TaxID=35708 RepID=A0A0A8ZNA1_ARUDO